MTILILAMVAITVFVLALVNLKKKEKSEEINTTSIPSKVEEVAVKTKKVVKKPVQTNEVVDAKKETPKKKYYYNSKKKK
jgi:hypothetical protein